jgi:hypothetical protein
MKPAFRDPLTNRKCLIPADGFHEWQRRGKAKQFIAHQRCNNSRAAFRGSPHLLLVVNLIVNCASSRHRVASIQYGDCYRDGDPSTEIGFRGNY